MSNTSNPVSHDRLALHKKMIFAMGMAPSLLMLNSINFLAMPVYNIALGVSPVLIGIALAIPKFWDAFTDPLMGNISDNTRTRFGRRRPYMAGGAIIGGVIYCFLWNPPTALGETGLFIYLTVISILLSTAYTVYMVPFCGLTYELTYDYNERTRLMTWRAWAGSLFGLLIGWAYKLCFLGTEQGASMQEFLRRIAGSNITQKLIAFFGNDELQGARAIGFIFGGIIILTGLIPSLFLREKVKRTENQAKIGIFKSLKYTFGNRVFLLLCAILFLFTVGHYMMQPLESYICIYYLYEGDKAAGAQLIGVALSVWIGVNLLAIPMIGWCGVKFGKRRTLIGAIILGVVGSFSRWFLMTPENPYLYLISQAILAPGVVSIWIMEGTMIADVTDMDELETHRRREGMFASAQSLIFKFAHASVLGLAGVLIVFTGVQIDLIGPQTPETVFRMKALFTFVPTVCLGIAAVLAWFYPLTRERCFEIRKELDARHAKNLAAETSG